MNQVDPAAAAAHSILQSGVAARHEVERKRRVAANREATRAASARRADPTKVAASEPAAASADSTHTPHDSPPHPREGDAPHLDVTA